MPVADLQIALEKRIEAFTIPILRSIDDVDASEVSKGAMAAEFRATDKRRIDPDKFTDELLLSLVTAAPASAPGKAKAEPVPAARDSGDSQMADLKARLARLKQLLDDGFITAEDYETKKAEILSEV